MGLLTEIVAILINSLWDYIYLIAVLSMQGNHPANILRNSYGYQIVDPPPLRSPNNKAYQLNQNYSFFNQQQESNIRQLENKLEGLAGKKTVQNEQNYQGQSSTRQAGDSSVKISHPFGGE